MGVVFNVNDYAERDTWIDGKGKAEKTAKEWANDLSPTQKVTVTEHTIGPLNMATVAQCLNGTDFSVNSRIILEVIGKKKE